MPEPQHTFVALYEGPTVLECRLLAASADPALVRLAAATMLTESAAKPAPSHPDPNSLLRLVTTEDEGHP